jgi:hypothetical protein
LHSIDDRFVFLGDPVKVPADVALLDTTLTLRAPSYGELPTTGVETDHSFTGRSQVEWAPTRLVANQSGSDWVLSWTPRWRLGNSANPVRSVHWTTWQLRITSAGTTVIKETTDPDYTYTSADQTTDFGAPLSTFDITIAGVNELTGPGDLLSETV